MSRRETNETTSAVRPARRRRREAPASPPVTGAPAGPRAGDAASLYRSRGFLGRLGFGERPAVVVVDVIVGFTDPASPLAADFDREVAAIRRLLAAARAAEIPIAFTTVAYDRQAREAGFFVKKVPALRVLVRGSRWVSLDPRLRRRADEPLYEKQFASAFFGTSLASYLTGQRVDTLIVTGVTTSGCVRATVVDALQHGFRPIVPRECVGDRAPGPHEANMFDIDSKYGDVVAVSEAIRMLGR
jgi:nicotinamidase-related amidase